MTGPTPQQWRALARSSPWLWRRAHFLLRRDADEQVEAWLDRRVGLRTEHGGVVVTSDFERRSSAWFGWDENGRPASGTTVEPVAWEVAVERDDDGLLRHRPDDYPQAEDLLWRDYRFVAMLDPVELADPDQSASGPATLIEQVTMTVRRDRETWWAELSEADGYDPRCTCCALLDGARAARLQADEGGHVAASTQPLPSRWRVGLDRATGIVVSLTPLDGVSLAGGFEVDLLDVEEV